MKLASDGDVKLEKLNGSWAGAFGQTQFMPSTYQRLAVDFDGDGRRDLIDSTADALASTAQLPGPGGLAPRPAVDDRGEGPGRLCWAERAGGEGAPGDLERSGG